MGLFDDLSGKLQDVAKKSGEMAQTAAKKSSDLIEITKLNIKIKESESDIRRNLVGIGKIVLEKYENESEIPDEFKEFINIIRVKKEVIEDLKSKIDYIKNNSDVEIKDEDIKLDEEFEIIDDDLDDKSSDEENKN